MIDAALDLGRAAVDYNDDARLDTSQVEDTRGGGGGGGLGGGLGGALGGMLGGKGIAVGGGGLGVVGVVIFLLVAFVGGGGGGQAASVLGELGNNGQPATADNSQLKSECRTGKDADEKLECAIVADIDSIQGYWASELPRLGIRYTPSPTVWFTGRVSTGCGAADSGVGPFYCPADKKVYIDLAFYDELKKQFGATGGPFVNAYVLAHEYGHHVQDLLGIEAKVRTRSGPSSDAVRLELQADCFAGVWARHATEPDANGQVLINSITQQDFADALDAASRIGDDFIQRNLGGGAVDTSKFTHGSSAQREKWLSTGYRTGDPTACDTFATNNLG